MEERFPEDAKNALFFIAGAFVGAGMALLFAPQSGRNTRKEILRAGRKACGVADDLARDLAKHVSVTADAIGKRTRELVETGMEIGDDGKKALLSVVDEGIARLGEQRARISRRIA
jgi:gas vesicle protein